MLTEDRIETGRIELIKIKRNLQFAYHYLHSIDSSYWESSSLTRVDIEKVRTAKKQVYDLINHFDSKR